MSLNLAEALCWACSASLCLLVSSLDQNWAIVKALLMENPAMVFFLWDSRAWQQPGPPRAAHTPRHVIPELLVVPGFYFPSLGLFALPKQVHLCSPKCLYTEDRHGWHYLPAPPPHLMRRFGRLLTKLLPKTPQQSAESNKIGIGASLPCQGIEGAVV